jgi:hypothetical protein
MLSCKDVAVCRDSWSCFVYYPCQSTYGVRKITKLSVRIVGGSAELRSCLLHTPWAHVLAAVRPTEACDVRKSLKVAVKMILWTYYVGQWMCFKVWRKILPSFLWWIINSVSWRWKKIKRERFEVLRAVLLKIHIFWNVTLFRWANSYRLFEVS